MLNSGEQDQIWISKASCAQRVGPTQVPPRRRESVILYMKHDVPGHSKGIHTGSNLIHPMIIHVILEGPAKYEKYSTISFNHILTN